MLTAASNCSCHPETACCPVGFFLELTRPRSIMSLVAWPMVRTCLESMQTTLIMECKASRIKPLTCQIFWSSNLVIYSLQPPSLITNHHHTLGGLSQSPCHSPKPSHALKCGVQKSVWSSSQNDTTTFSTCLSNHLTALFSVVLTSLIEMDRILAGRILGLFRFGFGLHR